jgi:hypothetical protein
VLVVACRWRTRGRRHPRERSASWQATPGVRCLQVLLTRRKAHATAARIPRGILCPQLADRVACRRAVPIEQSALILPVHGADTRRWCAVRRRQAAVRVPGGGQPRGGPARAGGGGCRRRRTGRPHRRRGARNARVEDSAHRPARPFACCRLYFVVPHELCMQKRVTVYNDIWK